MEVVQLQQKMPAKKPGQEMILAGDPKNPMPVPSSEIPPMVPPANVPQRPSPAPFGGQTQDDVAVDPLGEALPEPDAKELLSNLVESIQAMFSQEKFKKILSTAKAQGVYLTAQDHTVGNELGAAKKFLGK